MEKERGQAHKWRAHDEDGYVHLPIRIDEENAHERSDTTEEKRIDPAKKEGSDKYNGDNSNDKKRPLPDEAPWCAARKEEPNEKEERVKQKKATAARERPEKYLGHRTNKAFYFIITFLIVFCLFLIVSHYFVVQQLKAVQQRTLSELASAQSERDHYKTAYDVAVADAQAFSKMYDITYRGTNDSAAQNATAPQGSEQQDTSVKQLPANNVWAFYQEQGLITDACIPTVKIVQTPSDVVEVVLIASGKKEDAWPRVTLLIDGALMQKFDIMSERDGVYKTMVNLPKGEHHLDLIYDNAAAAGSVSVSMLRIGDRTIENGVSILDYGTSFAMFDCQDTGEGDTLKKDGAMRFKIEKV